MKKTVLINAFNSTAAGGRTILVNYVRQLETSGSQYQHIIFLRDKKMFPEFDCVECCTFLEAPKSLRSSAFTPVLNSIYLPWLLAHLNIDAYLNMSDVPTPTNVHQIFLFDWPYAAFRQSRAWKLLSITGYASRKFKLFLFQRYKKFIDLLIVQTPVMKEIMEKEYKFENTTIIPNAVSLKKNLGSSFLPAEFSGHTFLCLTHYYPHKNIEVLIPVANLLKERGIKARIITTISAEQGAGARDWLRRIEHENLTDVIQNVGPVKLDDVPALYRISDFLLLPTLLESFSGTYVEAMYYERPVLTSNLPFATGVCGDAALYFDPMDPDDVLRAITQVLSDDSLASDLARRGLEVVERMPNWPQVFNLFQQALTSRA